MLRGIVYNARRVLTRPRVFLKSWRKIGLAATVDLVRIRFGSRSELYRVRVPQWPHPVYVRGGPSFDTTVLYEMLVSEEYAPVGDLAAPQFIIDAGANIGMATLLFLNLYPTAHVVAIEPDQGNLDVCRRNLAPYAGRVTLLEGALWNRPGRLQLEPNREEWAIKVRNATPGEGGSVEAFTLPDIVARHAHGKPVDFLKIDIEGGEREIFDEESAEWLARVRNLAVETHGPDCVERFTSALRPFACEMTQIDAVFFCRNLRKA